MAHCKCTNCGAQLDLPPDEPCPNCGSTVLGVLDGGRPSAEPEESLTPQEVDRLERLGLKVSTEADGRISGSNVDRITEELRERRSRRRSRESVIDLRDVLRAHSTHDEPITPLVYKLARLGYIEEHELTQLLSKEYGVPEIDLSDFEIESEIIESVPCELAEKHHLIPVNRAGTSLIVAMSDPADADAIREIVELTQLNVEVVLASEQAIKKAIARFYPEPAPD